MSPRCLGFGSICAAGLEPRTLRRSAGQGNIGAHDQSCAMGLASTFDVGRLPDFHVPFGKKPANWQRSRNWPRGPQHVGRLRPVRAVLRGANGDHCTIRGSFRTVARPAADPSGTVFSPVAVFRERRACSHASTGGPHEYCAHLLAQDIARPQFQNCSARPVNPVFIPGHRPGPCRQAQSIAKRPSGRISAGSPILTERVIQVSSSTRKFRQRARDVRHACRPDRACACPDRQQAQDPVRESQSSRRPTCIPPPIFARA